MTSMHRHPRASVPAHRARGGRGRRPARAVARRSRRRHRPHHGRRRAVPAGDAPLWDARRRGLRWMDETGIDMQFVCATPVMFGYAWDVARAPRVGRAHERPRARILRGGSASPEGARAGAAAGHRRRVPRSDARATRAATSACRSATTSARRSLDDPGILDFLRHCASERDAGARPSVGHDGRRRGCRRWMLPWLVAMPAETQLGDPVADPVGRVRAAAAHARARVRARRRQLRLAARPRRQRVAAIATSCAPTARSCRRRIATASASTPRSSMPPRCACWSTGWAASACMLGTDAPFPLGEERPGELVAEAYAADAATRGSILAANAMRVFDLA